MPDDIALVPGISRTSASFRRSLLDTAFSLGTDVDWLAAIISRESGFRPGAVNRRTGATGLIQFKPSTALSLGTTASSLAAMTASEQLPYVKKYFSRFYGKLNTPSDVYTAVFTPSHVGKGEDNVIAHRGDAIYEANFPLDLDNDGTITNGDLGKAIERTLSDSHGRISAVVEPGTVEAASQSTARTIGPYGPIVLVSLLYLYLRAKK